MCDPKYAAESIKLGLAYHFRQKMPTHWGERVEVSDCAVKAMRVGGDIECRRTEHGGIVVRRASPA